VHLNPRRPRLSGERPFDAACIPFPKLIRRRSRFATRDQWVRQNLQALRSPPALLRYNAQMIRLNRRSGAGLRRACVPRASARARGGHLEVGCGRPVARANVNSLTSNAFLIIRPQHVALWEWDGMPPRFSEVRMELSAEGEGVQFFAKQNKQFRCVRGARIR
jgi:hypothetical protein